MSISQSPGPGNLVGWKLPGLLRYMRRFIEPMAHVSPTRILRAGQTAMWLAGCMIEQGRLRSISQDSQQMRLEMKDASALVGLALLVQSRLGCRKPLASANWVRNTPTSATISAPLLFRDIGRIGISTEV